MPISIGFNHVATLTSDMASTVGFYEKVLDAVDHFAFAVADRASLETVRIRLGEAGAQEVGEIQQLGSELSLFFRDPDGLELEVCAPGLS